MTEKETIPVLEANEGGPVYYVTNEYVKENIGMHTENWKINFCSHVTEDGVLPRGIQAINEGGYNNTLICLDCLLEWVADNEP